MTCALPLYRMTPKANLSRMVLTLEVLRNSEIAQRIKEATDMDDNVEFLIPSSRAPSNAAGCRVHQFGELLSAFPPYLPT